MTAVVFDDKQTQDLKQDGRRGGLVIALRHVSTGETWSLETGARRRWLIGKDGTCDVRLVNDACVSNVHCVLERRGDGALVLRDRESRNGTYIDGNPIEAAELRSGSYVSIGRTTLLALGAAATSGGSSAKAIELIKGSDPKTRVMVEQAIRAAQTDCSVLVVGETGTGKDLVARLIHESSRRSQGPFVAVNCGAIPRELIASELFGHERGAFTGATESREGYFVEAHGGTLFLDEIAELPIELQPHLLRALETRRVRRVGAHAERSVDVRIIAATNRTAGLGTESSALRIDLYHRIATVVLRLQPLRERLGDLVDIVQTVVAEMGAEFGEKRISADAWHALTTYPWPGNVRELRGAVSRAIALGGKELGPMDFFPDLVGRTRAQTERDANRANESGAGSADGDASGRGGDTVTLPYEAILRATMVRALAEHGTIRAAANAIGMPKSTFADKAREWGILIPRRRRRLFRLPPRSER